MNHKSYIEANIKQIKTVSHLPFFYHNKYNKVEHYSLSARSTIAIAENLPNKRFIKIFSNKGQLLRHFTLLPSTRLNNTPFIDRVHFLSNGLLAVITMPLRYFDNWHMLIFDPTQGKLLKTLTLGIVLHVFISLPNNQLAFTNVKEENIQILNCLTGKITKILPTKNYLIENMQVLPNGDIFTIQLPTNKDKSLSYRIYNLETGHLIKTIPQNEHPMQGLVFPEGDIALFGFWDDSIHFMNTKNGKIFYEYKIACKDMSLASFHREAIKIYETKDLKNWDHSDSLSKSIQSSCSMF